MLKKKINYIITDNNITVNYDGQTHIVSRQDVLANKLIEAVREQRLDLIPNLVSAAKRIEEFSNGEFVVNGGEIFVNGKVAPRVLGDKIVKFSNEGLPYKPLVKFAENLQKNPSFRAVNELFSFLEKNDHPIIEEGLFIAYKRVRSDFKDIHSGTFDNSVGKTVEMPRNEVNEDPNMVCAEGLHCANWDYAHTKFGSSTRETDIMLEVEVNPADVISVPVDYSNSKMRVCKYKVLGVVDKEHSSDDSLRYSECTSDDCCQSEPCKEDMSEDIELCEICGADTDPEFNLCQDCEDDQREEEDYPFDNEL